MKHWMYNVVHEMTQLDSSHNRRVERLAEQGTRGA